MEFRSQQGTAKRRSKGRPARLKQLIRAEGGASAVEFAIIIPLLLLAFMTVVKLGVAINNYIEMTSGTRAAARVLAVARGSATPYTDSLAAFRSSASNLSKSTLPSMTVNGGACNTDTPCQAMLSTASGTPVVVKVSYNCDLKIMGFDFAPGCQLSSQTTERAE